MTHVIKNSGRDKLTLELYMNDTTCSGGSCQYDFDGGQLYYNGTVVDDADTSQLACSAGTTWVHGTTWDKALGGTVSYTSHSGDSVTRTFYGDSVTYVYTKASNRATANVVVDGTAYTIPEYAVAPSGELGWWQQSATFPVNPNVNPHTITISHSGIAPNCTAPCYIDVDALIAK